MRRGMPRDRGCFRQTLGITDVDERILACQLVPYDVGFFDLCVRTGHRGALVAGVRYIAKPTISEALFSYRRAA
jgi:hypothetical protein